MIEFELKFQVDAAHRAAGEAAVARGRSHRTPLHARYFDTADGALAAQHIVLRIRHEDGGWVQTVKAPGRSLVERLEHNVTLPPLQAGEAPQPRIGRHAGTPVGKRIKQALQAAGHDPENIVWVPLYEADIWRTRREMRSGDARIELAFDSGDVRSGPQAQAICELEIELKDGSASALIELARRWRTRYGLWLDTVSKSERGERLARGVRYGSPVKAQPLRLATQTSAPALLCAVLGNCLAQILPNASELAAGSPDPEHVHQLRIGLRRLRSALRELKDLAPTIDPAWEPALAEVFSALGQRRDQEHVMQRMQQQLASNGAPPMAILDTANAPSPAEVVRTARFQSVLMDLIAAALPEQDWNQVGDKAAPPARKTLRKQLSKLHQQVLRDGRRFDSLDAAQQHRVRKRLKRLRYLSEFVAPLFNQRATQRFLATLEPAQDLLGQHNDAATAMAAYRQQAAQDGAAWFAVGWLAATQAASAMRCRKALTKAAKARPFWKA